MKKQIYLLMALLVAVAGMAYADYYTWEDEHGVVQITDYPPPETQKAKKVRIHKEAKPAPDPADRTGQAVEAPNIVLYTKNDCEDCQSAREYLQTEGLIYTEYNLDEDETAVAARKTIDGGEDVPFAIINNQHIYGFSASVYQRVLKRSP